MQAAHYAAEAARKTDDMLDSLHTAAASADTHVDACQRLVAAAELKALEAAEVRVLGQRGQNTGWWPCVPAASDWVLSLQCLVGAAATKPLPGSSRQSQLRSQASSALFMCRQPSSRACQQRAARSTGPGRRACGASSMGPSPGSGVRRCSSRRDQTRFAASCSLAVSSGGAPVECRL